MIGSQPGDISRSDCAVTGSRPLFCQGNVGMPADQWSDNGSRSDRQRARWSSQWGSAAGTHAEPGADAGRWRVHHQPGDARSTAACRPEQVSAALGPDVDRIAQEAGVPKEQAAAGIAAVLPQVVDIMTPGGDVPSSGDLSSIINGVLGKN